MSYSVMDATTGHTRQLPKEEQRSCGGESLALILSSGSHIKWYLLSKLTGLCV